MEIILECKGVTKKFGEFTALDNVSFSVPTRSIFGIAGPNGAGKTTLFNCITCNPYRLSSGKIIFKGEEIQKLNPWEIVHKGIARTFQIPVRFKGLSYFKTVLIGAIFGSLTTFKDVVLQYDKHRFDRKAHETLEFVGLINKKDTPTLHASLYDLKRLMIASALATEPKLLLLDEPVSGLTDHEIKAMWNLLIRINKELGITIIIVEHIMRFLMNISDIVLILNAGKVVRIGNPGEVAKDPEVIKCYLG
ncbi:MAG: ABC transporter ATP-binding protein, partial [Thermofilaceae archaeon]